MRSIFCVILLSIGTVAGAAVVTAAAPSPSPSSGPPSTPKPFPNTAESISFLNRTSLMNGFVIFATPSPMPSTSPKAPSTAKATPLPSQEKISQIDRDCGFASAGGGTAPIQTFVPGVAPKPALPPCIGVYVDAKKFLALFNAKIKAMQVPQNPDPSTIDWSKAQRYYRGSLTFTFCKNDYTQTFYMSKLASLGGKPVIDPVEFLAQINPHILTKYHVTLFLPSKATMDAANKAKAPQPLYSLQIQGALPACKAKKPASGWLMDFESTSDGHDPRSGGEIHAVVKAHIVLNKSSGSMTFYKPVASNPATTIGFQGSGPVSYESATLTGTKCSIGGTTPGTAYVSLLGGNTLAIGFSPLALPQEIVVCPMGGSGPAPTWWGIFYYTHRTQATVAGGTTSMMPLPTVVLPMSGSVDGTQTFTSSYSGPNKSGTQITENTTITLIWKGVCQEASSEIF